MAGGRVSAPQAAPPPQVGLGGDEEGELDRAEIEAALLLRGAAAFSLHRAESRAPRRHQAHVGCGEGSSLSPAALKHHPIPDAPASPSSCLIPFLPISPLGTPGPSPSSLGSSLAASGGHWMYLPGSGITVERVKT